MLLLGKYKYYMNAQMELKMPPKCWEKNLQFITKQTTCDQLSSERSSSKTSLILLEKKYFQNDHKLCFDQKMPTDV